MQVRLRESMTKLSHTPFLQPNSLVVTVQARFRGPILTIRKNQADRYVTNVTAIVLVLLLPQFLARIKKQSIFPAYPL